MIRIIDERLIEGNKKLINAAGTQGDIKPTENLVTGSKFLEVDTHSEFLFDETSQTWFARNP